MYVYAPTVLLVVAAASVVTSATDYGAVVDKLLKATSDKIPLHVPFTQLHYDQRTWDAVDQRFNVVARLEGVNGRLELGMFERDGAPQLRGPIDDQILEFNFIIGLSITYDNFTAENFTSGEASHGQMTVFYNKAEIRTSISIKSSPNLCTSSVQTFEPTTLSDPSVLFNATSTDLPLRLFSEAKFTLNFYLNRTLVTEGLPTFAGVVAGTDMCSSLD